jgi:hypothetical protein
VVNCRLKPIILIVRRTELQGRLTLDTWDKKHVLKIRDDRSFRHFELTEESGESLLIESGKAEKKFTAAELRREIEPWLTALFQSEHLSLLTGAGISSAVHELATGSPGAGMNGPSFSIFNEQIDLTASKSAKVAGRGIPNIEDRIRVANSLLEGLKIYASSEVYGAKKLRKELSKLEDEIHRILTDFTNAVLKYEGNVVGAGEVSTAADNLMSFLVSFASRSSTRERLNIFTTNYDRIMEYGAELAGIRLLDRFVGSVYPIFRASRLEIDMHYNPPGIRGEPRYLEGVTHFTKLHGSLDWIYHDGYVRRVSLPFGCESIETYLPKWGTEKTNARSLMIYPNAAKDRETSEYPYVELFRDFAAAVCRPNSTLVIYGYSFGDEHINRIIKDMLTIPSTHLVIIVYGDEGDRVQSFYQQVHRAAQMTLLIGSHFGHLKTLVDYYLPKPAIDRATFRMAELLKARGVIGSGRQEGKTPEGGSNEPQFD